MADHLIRVPGVLVRLAKKWASTRTTKAILIIVLMQVMLYVAFQRGLSKPSDDKLEKHVRDRNKEFPSVLQNNRNTVTAPESKRKDLIYSRKNTNVKVGIARQNEHQRKVPVTTAVIQRPGVNQNQATIQRPVIDAVVKMGAAERRQKYLSELLALTDSPVLARGCEARGWGGKVTNLVFVKVHKSASSTVSNLLARYALRHSLHVALPRKVPGTIRFNYFEGVITHKSVFPAPPGERFHVMLNHMIFNRQAIQRLMPRDTFYFAIMRDPEERFISSLFYYGIAGNIARRFGLSDVRQAVALILQHPGLLDRTKPEYFNSMSADTGLEPALQHDPRAVGSHIDKLEQDLDLVLVVEYFDESLVLLKRKACLAMKDILYKKKNARKSETHVPLSPEDRQRFRQQQMADVLVYDHFYKRFWGEVLAYGPDFFNEVRHFREIQRDVADFCAGVVSVWDCLVVNDSAWNEKFLVTARECRLMKITELEMQTYLLERAGRSYKLGQQYRRFRPGRAEDTGRVQAFGVIG